MRLFHPIAGLQMTDVELDARVTALEDNGGGNSLNGKDILHVVILKNTCLLRGKLI